VHVEPAYDRHGDPPHAPEKYLTQTQRASELRGSPITCHLLDDPRISPRSTDSSRPGSYRSARMSGGIRVKSSATRSRSAGIMWAPEGATNVLLMNHALHQANSRTPAQTCGVDRQRCSSDALDDSMILLVETDWRPLCPSAASPALGFRTRNVQIGQSFSSDSTACRRGRRTIWS
jgi:hypothetical protein